MRIRLGCNNNRVLRSSVHDDDRGTTRARHDGNGVGAYATSSQVGQQRGRRRIITHRADKLHLRASTRRGHRLVGTLSAGCVNKC